MKLIVENWRKFLREQEENLTEEEVILYLQHTSIGLYKGQETNRLFWSPNKITSLNPHNLATNSGQRAFQEAGINVSNADIEKIKEKIISKVNKGEKIGNYNITEKGVQNKHYGDALISFMKKYGKPNSNVLYSGGTIQLKGLSSTTPMMKGLWSYVRNLIDLGFPKEKMEQTYYKDPKSLIPPEGGRKLPSLKDFKMAIAKKLLKDYSYDPKIKKIAKDGGIPDAIDIQYFDAKPVDINLLEYGVDSGFGLYKTLKAKYEYIVEEIKNFEKHYNNTKNAIKNINPAQIPPRRRVIHSFSSDIKETKRFMSRRDPEDDMNTAKKKGHHPCVMIVEAGDASKTMPIEAEQASTTEKETIIFGKYKTIKLDIDKDGIVLQYVKFE